MTKKENFAQLRTIAIASNRQDLVDFIDHEVELITKKNSAPKKPTERQLENEKLKDVILDEILVADPMTATEIANALNVSTSRATAIITQLIEDNSVVRTVVKRKAYFSKA